MPRPEACVISWARWRCARSEQPHGRRERRVADVVGQPAEARRRAAPHGQVEDLLGDLGHAVEVGAAAGQHDAGVERLLVARAVNLVPHEVEHLLGARLQHLRQDPPRHRAGRPAADAGHVHRLVVADHGRERAAAPALQLLGLGDRHAQADGDVVGEMVAAEAARPPCARGTPARRSRGRSCRRRCRAPPRRVPSRRRVSTASLAASCSSTDSCTLTPALFTQRHDVLRRRRCRRSRCGR